jgi:predicted metal-dependent phosphoesterase TrpH
VPRYKFEPREAIQLIKNAGGAAVLAHPGLIKNDTVVVQLLDQLKIDGIEVFYPEHSPEETDRYLKLAETRGLLVTGGSDYHGSDRDTHSKLGSSQVESPRIEAIRRYLQAVDGVNRNDDNQRR